MPVLCNFCGAELKPHSRFCLQCGQLVSDASESLPQQAPASYASQQPVPSAGSPVLDAALTLDAQPPTAAAPLSPLPQQAPPASALGYSVMLSFADGSAVIIDDDSLLGRKPQATADAEGLIAVPIVDPLKSSSRVHLRLYLTPQGVNVVDAGSGNGTTVEHAGTRYETRAHEPFWIEPGDRLWLGEVPVDVTLA